MSAFDIAISETIWDGKLPLQVTFHPTESISSARTPDPIYIEVARLSYLSLLTHQLHSIYTGLGIQTQPENVWYDYNGEPLKWHFPIGLLYDLYNFPISQVPTFGEKASLPWRINIHFDEFPIDKILRNPTLDTTQDMFMSMLKEADFLRHGTTKRVMNMSKRDQTQLWQSLVQGKYSEYWSVNKHLLENGQLARHIPLRLYMPYKCPPIQELVPGNTEEHPLLIGDAMTRILPDLFPSDDQEECDAIPVIHGVPLPLDTPLGWASDNLCFADNFLHIVISKKGTDNGLDT
ncbi:autophagy protein Apg5-domain-containing protein [Phycomyces blakesleeanus]|uniref:Autophagy protein 5 n=2 Tax=Phycomyces blakesleeanus TaxID=4837 RepID=A0A163AU09_PHYB8|nr:hypothetical protein PHYBLDRAFT_59343 [Phycomyces blakesleeanus NRRL 1555(-)]OAD75811.1 hypothetical protein PHYBLDRAFT_59343 [Phycomyces blakesleeanus NRRL 1555(-)]|eukprot:XP_018293851.1 hypothetical protein PHYBLDRAFT_59343 [Phycomyces blakesleeanus NRRL 1555(-)]